MKISAQGEIDDYSFYEAVIKSHARLTYTKVADAIVERKPAALKAVGGLLPQLENLHAMYKKMEKARQKRGAIDFDTIETKFEFTDEMRIKNIHPLVRNDAHKIIEECMIAANICAARFITRYRIPSLYRVHEAPDDEKLEELRGFLGDLGLKLGAPSRKISPKDYAKLSSTIKKREDTHLIQTLMLRSMQQAVYRADNVGHFGLALKHYAHFTSPIRRYPDLLVHRAIKHIIHKRKKREFPYDQNTMNSFGEHCSTNERRADEATRDAEFAMKCEYMLDKVGTEFTARVTGVVSFGLFVELDEYYVEGLIHITSLPKDYYDFDPISHRLVGENRGMVFRLSDKVDVRLSNVDMDERRIDFELIK
jgi:ribonuclease R